ncbi:MAG TPA: response regulator transcription factor [Acidimicrobiia bacterium]|nr:response regulator transcription factor [Acidimicrobiia bacterium]
MHGEQIRLLLVEDSAALGKALVFAFEFEDGIEPVGVAPTIRKALEMVAGEKPDVVLMDVRLPDGSGIDAVSRVLELRPETSVIVMTAHADNLMALDAADAGAAGFILKDVRIAKIVAGVRRAVTEALAVDNVMLQAVLTQATATASAGVELSASQSEVASLLAEGLDRQAIAARLAITEDEVTVMAAALREHLGARSNLEAVVKAARAGLFGPDQGSKARISNR